MDLWVGIHCNNRCHSLSTMRIQILAEEMHSFIVHLFSVQTLHFACLDCYNQSCAFVQSVDDSFRTSLDD